MVHALKEAYRILVPGGIMIDVRPLSINVPLEIIYEGGSESAGMIDMSPEIKLDIAADRAIEIVVSGQVFNERKVEHFDFTYYWETVEGMEADIEERWQGEVVITEEVWLKAHKLFDLKRPKTQIRVACKMKLGAYEKNQ